MSTQLKKVTLTVSSLLADLNNGLSWLKKDDLGQGSIQEKYGATEFQVIGIRNGHPVLKIAEPARVLFELVDDLKPKEGAQSAAASQTQNILSQAVATPKETKKTASATTPAPAPAPVVTAPAPAPAVVLNTPPAPAPAPINLNVAPKATAEQDIDFMNSL